MISSEQPEIARGFAPLNSPKRYLFGPGPSMQVVAYVHAETSTGAVQRGQAICKAAHEANAIVIADCVTSLGGIPIEADQTIMPPCRTAITILRRSRCSMPCTRHC
jgi:cysteine sulfinate desulfinase/cysteine desulfurase-like protein